MDLSPYLCTILILVRGARNEAKKLFWGQKQYDFNGNKTGLMLREFCLTASEISKLKTTFHGLYCYPP